MSKNITIFLLLFFGFMRGIAQSTTNLDSTSGFRQFRFLAKPSEMKEVRKVPTHIYNKDFVREYLYVGPDTMELNTVKINRIILSFYENKLFGIRICYDSSAQVHINDDFNKIQYGLAAKYGTGWIPTPNDGRKDITGCTWRGQKVLLENVMSSDGYGYINILNRELYKEVMTDK